MERKETRAPVSYCGRNDIMGAAISLTNWHIGSTRASWTTPQSKAIGQTCVKRLLVARALSCFLSDQRKIFLKRNFVVPRPGLHRRKNHDLNIEPPDILTDLLVDGLDKLEDLPQSSSQTEHLHHSKAYPPSVFIDMFSDGNHV